MKLADDNEVRYGTTTRWKGKRLLTTAEKLAKQRAFAKAWRAKNREKISRYFAEYRAAHPELKTSQKAYYRANIGKWKARPNEDPVKRRARELTQRPALNAARRAWAKRNPERAKAIERRTRERNRERKREADKVYRQLKPEIYKSGIARSKAAKPDLYRAIAVQSSLRRRARRRSVPVERVSRKRILLRDAGVCHLCGLAIQETPHFDHLIPIVRGGAHAEWNLMLAHDRCNKSRGTKQILHAETKEAAEAYIATRVAAQKDPAA